MPAEGLSLNGVALLRSILDREDWELLFDHLAAEFRQEQPLEYFGQGDRVVILGTESFEVKRSGVTIRGSHYAEIVDLRDGLITRFLIIQDLSAFVEAYHTSDPP
jgi:hypothetical protein